MKSMLECEFWTYCECDSLEVCAKLNLKPPTMLERIESVIKDNIEAALPKGIVIDYHYAAVEVLRVLGEPSDAMSAVAWNNGGFIVLDGYSKMIAAARD